MHQAFVRRTLLFLTAASLSAVVSDWAIEGAAGLGLYGSAFAEHEQRSIICTVTAAAIVLVSCFVAVSLQRLSHETSLAGDWLAEAAHDLASKPWSVRTLSQSFVVALLVRYGMEAAREYQVSGHVPIGFDWLGGPLAVALLVHLCFCIGTFFGLVGLMVALDRTVRHVVGLVIAFIVAIDRALSDSTCFIERDHTRIVDRLSLLARHLGERAPPPCFDAALV